MATPPALTALVIVTINVLSGSAAAMISAFTAASTNGGLAAALAASGVDASVSVAAPPAPATPAAPPAVVAQPPPAGGDGKPPLAESNSHAAMRGIPHEFHDLIRVLSAAGQPPAAVDKVLRAAADRDNIDVTWVYNDVYHFMTATTAEKAFDATGFLEQLEERRKLYGLPFYYLTDADGRLSRVFVVLAGGLEGYAKSISFVDDVEVNQAAVQYDLTVRYPALHSICSVTRRACCDAAPSSAGLHGATSE